MATTIIVTALLLLTGLAMGGGATGAHGHHPTEPNEPQQGEVETCLRNHALPFWGIIVGGFGSDDDPELVQTEGGTFFKVDHDSISSVQITFIDQQGTRLFYWGDSGQVPEQAVTASVCISATSTFNPIPWVGQNFTYQDGFLHAPE